MLKEAWKKLSWSVAQRGVWGTLRVALRRAVPGETTEGPVEHVFDREFGVETSGFIGAWKLGGRGANQRYSNPYYGVPPSRLREALRRWRQMVEDEGRAVEEFAFLDIGCGKGRAMMIASEMPFREVVGLELSGELVEIAQRNFERWRQLGRARSRLEVMEGDATMMPLPPGPWLIFMYNSFQAPVMRTMLERLEAVAGESAGTMDLLYFVPSQEAVFMEFPRFARVWSEVIPLSEEDASVDRVSSPEDRCSLYRR